MVYLPDNLLATGVYEESVLTTQENQPVLSGEFLDLMETKGYTRGLAKAAMDDLIEKNIVLLHANPQEGWKFTLDPEDGNSLKEWEKQLESTLDQVMGVVDHLFRNPNLYNPPQDN